MTDCLRCNRSMSQHYGNSMRDPDARYCSRYTAETFLLEPPALSLDALRARLIEAEETGAEVQLGLVLEILRLRRAIAAKEAAEHDDYVDWAAR